MSLEGLHRYHFLSEQVEYKHILKKAVLHVTELLDLFFTDVVILKNILQHVFLRQWTNFGLVGHNRCSNLRDGIEMEQDHIDGIFW